MNKGWIFLVMLVISLLFVNAQITDTDGDGMPDSWEQQYGLNPLVNDANEDIDLDTLTNLLEYILGGNPLSDDSDFDGFTDGDEVYYGANITNSNVFPTHNPNNISLVSPKYGVAKVSIFDFSVRTLNASACKYSTSPNAKYNEIDSPSNIFSTANGIIHTKSSFNVNLPDNFPTSIYVICKTNSGFINDLFPQKINLSVDRTPPFIANLEANPKEVIETLETELIAETNEKTVCRFDQPNASLVDYQAFFNNAKLADFEKINTLVLNKNSVPAIQDNTNYVFIASCMNKAGWFLEKTAIINLSVDLTTQNQIISLSPQGFINKLSANVIVVTNKDSNCFFGDNYVNQFPQTNAKVHFIEKQLLEGVQEIPILCVFNDLGTLSKTIKFTVDQTDPSPVTIRTKAETCSLNKLDANFSSTDNIGISGHVFRIYNSTNLILNDTFTNLSSISVSGLNLTRGERYYFEARSLDFAGNDGIEQRSNSIAVLAETDEKCRTNSAPRLNISMTSNFDRADLKLQCEDDDGDCTGVEYFLIDSQTNSSCQVCGQCYKRYFAFTQISAKENSRLCYKISDDKNKTVENFTLISVNLCLNTQDGCCNSNEDGICDTPDCSLTEDIDCSPEKRDSDLDGMPDAFEDKFNLNKNLDDASLDKDSDGLTNLEEFRRGTDPTLKDTDNDGYDDKTEINAGTDPTDFSSSPNDPNKDTDKDGITDEKEIRCGLDKDDGSDADKDYDSDGLTNREECVTYRTDINLADTDGDGVSDKTEVDKNTNPRNEEDFPKSHLINILLFVFGLGSIVAGIVMYTKDTKTPKAEPFDSDKKPLVDFKTTKENLEKEIKIPKEAIKEARKRPKISLNDEIRKKREMIRLRKMENIFDEFAQGKSSPKRKGLLQKSDGDAFAKLEGLYNKDAFAKLDKISKKTKKK